MKIALIGGTHGNEPVGLEVMSLFKAKQDSMPKSCNRYRCFWGNPRAYQEKRRYIDSDLNRAFGKNSTAKGYEKLRAEELTKEIKGHFDFSIDLHTTTSNMGLTIILNNTHPLTRKLAGYVKQKIPEIKLIEEVNLDDECNHLNRLCPAGVTVEVGPVANNVVNANLVKETCRIVDVILNFDFATEINLGSVPFYKMLGTVEFPSSPHWYVHPNVEANDFCELNPGDPIFINYDGETLASDFESKVYPFFINEAAYQENRTAFLFAEKRTSLQVSGSLGT